MTRIFARPDREVDEAELEAFAARLFASLRSEAPPQSAVERARATLEKRLRAQPEPAAVGWGGLRRALVGGIALLPLAAAGTVAAMSGGGVGPIDVPRIPAFSGASGHSQEALEVGFQQQEEGGETPEATDTPSETPSTTPTPGPRGPLGPAEGSNGHGASICVQANAHAQSVLRALLESGRLGAEGQAGVSHALEALENCGNGDEGGAPEPPGPPSDVPRGGPPEGLPPGPPDGVPPGPPPHANGNGRGAAPTPESAGSASAEAGVRVGRSGESPSGGHGLDLAGEITGSFGAVGSGLDVAAGARGGARKGR